MALATATVERVRSYWRWWAAQTSAFPSVSVVVVGGERFVRAPDRLREQVVGEQVTDLRSLVEAVGEPGTGTFGEARLSYVDHGTLRPVATDGMVVVGDDDPRLAAIEASSDPAEWSEASVDEPCEHRFGFGDAESLLAVVAVQVWNDTLGHVGIFTCESARGRGLASSLGGAAAERALALGLVPQWRARVGNDASARVADKLGFVALGTQLFVRVAAQ